MPQFTMRFSAEVLPTLAALEGAIVEAPIATTRGQFSIALKVVSVVDDGGSVLATFENDSEWEASVAQQCIRDFAVVEHATCDCAPHAGGCSTHTVQVNMGAYSLELCTAAIDAGILPLDIVATWIAEKATERDRLTEWETLTPELVELYNRSLAHRVDPQTNNVGTDPDLAFQMLLNAWDAIARERRMMEQVPLDRPPITAEQLHPEGVRRLLDAVAAVDVDVPQCCGEDMRYRRRFEMWHCPTCGATQGVQP